MYLREPFQIDDRELQLDIIREDGWGHIIGVEDGAPYVSHHPFALHGAPGEEQLEFHLPKASPHWRAVSDGGQKLVVFEGPKHYVSPKWCQDENALPTWVYAAVHIYGRPKLIEDAAQIRAGLVRLIDFNETRFDDPWSLDAADQDRVNNTMRRIVGFEMPIERIEANFRLMQDRPASRRNGVTSALNQLNDTRASAVAALMGKHSRQNAD